MQLKEILEDLRRQWVVHNLPSIVELLERGLILVFELMVLLDRVAMAEDLRQLERFQVLIEHLQFDLLSQLGSSKQAAEDLGLLSADQLKEF